MYDHHHGNNVTASDAARVTSDVTPRPPHQLCIRQRRSTVNTKNLIAVPLQSTNPSIDVDRLRVALFNAKSAQRQRLSKS